MFKRIVFTMLILIPVIFYSQTLKDTTANSLKKYSMSLQFGIGANFNLEPVNNYSISAKLHLSKIFAFRMGVGGNYSNKKGTAVIDLVNYETKHHSYNVSFEFLFMFYFNPSSKVNVFAGAGPLYNYTYSEDKTPYYYQLYDYNTKTNGIGPKIAIGGEWFFTNKMSLFAEYEAFYTFGKFNSYERREDLVSSEFHTMSIDQDDNELQANTARLGLSLYF